MAAGAGQSSRSCSDRPIRPPAIRPSRSTRPVTRTTPRSASDSSGRPTRRTPTYSWPTPATAAGRGPRFASPPAAATSAASAIFSTRNTSPPGATATRSSPLATFDWLRKARSSAPESSARSLTTAGRRGRRRRSSREISMKRSSRCRLWLPIAAYTWHSSIRPI